jgi:hypothetical protein
MQFKSFMEALKGKQHKIDKNKNNKIDAQDFEILRKEEAELEESEERMARADYKVSPSGRKSHKEIVFNSGEENEKKEKIEEKAPPGFEGTVKAMKKHKEIDNPYALAWYMKNKGMKSHKKASGAMKEEAEQIEEGNLSVRHLYNKFADAHAAGNDTKSTEKAIKKVHGDEVFKHMKKAATANAKGDMDGEERHFDNAQTAARKTDRIGSTVGRDRSAHRKQFEEVEHIEEKSDQAKQNKTMKNMMDASRGARFKLNNPVPDAEPEHKTARAHNVAIGRALRKEDAEQVEEGYYEKPASAYRRKGDEIGGGSPWNRQAPVDSVPFDGPYTKATGNTTDKSGAVHSPMSRAKHLAKMAMKKSMKEDIDRLFEKDDSEYNYEGEMAVTQLKTISRHAEALQAKMKPDTNLPEWVQSKITLATDYMQTAHDYLMSELDEQAPVAPVPGMKFKNHAVMVHPETKSRVVINRKNIDNYTSDGYKEVRPGQKLKEDEEVKFSYTELMMINEIKLADLPVRRVKGHSYGADYSDPEGADDMWDKESLKKPTAEKRGRGRPAGSQSGARKNYGSSKLHTK